jgi:phosphatidylglycerol:prolipoprotein diacylglycerol transferase
VYETGSAPHLAHSSKGLIDSNAAVSLPIHPTQLYEIIFCLVFALFLCKHRRLWKAPGNLFYSQIILYGLFRFFAEFVRAGGTTILGLKYVQWELLSAVVLVASIATFRERRWRLQPRTLAIPASIPRKNLISISAIFLVLWIGMDWFTPLELVVLKLFALPILAGAGFELMQRLDQFRLRWAMAGVVVASPILFGGKLENATPPDTAKSNYTTISAGAMRGRYQEENCNRITNHTYGVGGGGISHTQRFGEFNKLTYGIRGYLGTDEGDNSFSIRGINPYVQYDIRWVGFGLGGHAGDLIFDGDPENLYPQASLRIGPYDKFFVEGRLADHFPGSWPDPLIKLGIGFGLKNEGSLRLGISSAGGNGTDLYVNPYIPLNGRFVIDPFLAYGSKSGQESYQLGLTLHYRFHR